jgi:photosystem II stability/assembly factor-like uncharacterized protein
MSRIVFVLAVGALVLTVATVNAQTWEWQRRWIPQGPLNCVKAIDTNNVWIGGSSGRLLHTMDGGTTWSTVILDYTEDLWYIETIGSDYLWVCGGTGHTSGFVARSTDGGLTWQIHDTLNTEIIESISFVDALNGWIAGDYGVSFRTTDGGSTWATSSIPYMSYVYGIEFVDTLNGWAVSNAETFRTTNGGISWATVSMHRSFYGFDIRFVSPTCGWAVGSAIMHYDGRDSSWTLQDTFAWNQRQYSVSFPDSLHGWTAGRGGIILHTDNGGAQWTSQNCGLASVLRSISFADSLHGWVVGDAGIIRKTRNGGNTWTDVYGNISVGSLKSIACDSAGQQIWAVGDRGMIVFSDDGGRHWDNLFMGTELTPKHIQYLNGEVWVVGETGLVAVLSVSTQLWSLRQITENTLEGVDFIDSDYGWAVGWNGTIIRTTDGGISWSSLTLFDPSFLKAVSFSNRLNGCIVGEAARILHTTDGGATWVVVSANTADVLNDVKLLTNGWGWAVGQSGTILKTADGGFTWNRLPNTPAEPMWIDVECLGPDTVWVFSDGGVSYRSTNRGASWTQESIYHGMTINDVVFSGDGRQAWTCGEFEQIMHYTAPSAVTPPLATLPQSCALNVYPNPFNVVAQLKIELPRAGKITLRVYDVNGRLAQTVAERVFPAGTHTLTFDGSQLPSGIYFARLSAGELTAQQKLVLIK